MVSVNDLVLVQGMRDTRDALKRWHSAPLVPLRPWLRVSLGAAALLLFAVWAVAKLSPTDPTPLRVPGVTSEPELRDYLAILYRNSLVLALHAMACVAGFMAGSSLPLSAANRHGFDRWVHEHAGRFAILFVGAATIFSMSTQAYAIGGLAADVSHQLNTTPTLLVIGLLPHAVPELAALFLPLAAWLVASRRGRWDELLAATFVTVAIAVPVVLTAAAIELWISPHWLELIVGA